LSKVGDPEKWIFEFEKTNTPVLQQKQLKARRENNKKLQINHFQNFKQLNSAFGERSYVTCVESLILKKYSHP